jgi:hypothetical protein
MKKYISVLFLLTFIIPSVTFASWWNPLSWFNGWRFNKIEKIEETQKIKLEKTPEQQINDLQKQLDELKNQQDIKIPTNKNVINNNFKNESIIKADDKSPVQNQTEEYKKNLINQVMEIIAVLKSSSTYIDEILPHIDNRISILNKMISENQSIIKNAPDSVAIDLTNNLIGIYKLDTQSSDITKDTLKGFKNLNQKTIDSLSTEGVTIINQLASISSDEFNKYYNANLKLKDEADSIFSSIKKIENEWLTSVKEQNNYYDNFFTQLKIKINNMKSNYSTNTQVYYPSYQLTPPIIKVPKVQKCYFSSYSNSNSYDVLTKTSGQITCY